MGSSSKKQTVGYKYYLGMHLALCHGPVDKLIRIQVDGKDAWVGNVAIGSVAITAPDLFGGESREGGVSGIVDFEQGGPSQGQNSYLASKLGALVPNFRGVCAAVLRQCYVGMNPYLKPWAFRLQRIHTRNGGVAQWYDAKAAIYSLVQVGSIHETFADGMGPYELVTGLSSGAYSLSGFSVVADDYGQAMRVDPGPASSHSTIQRALNINGTLKSFECKFKVVTLGSDDNGEIDIYDSLGNRTISFSPARDSGADALQRPSVCGTAACGDGNPVGSAHAVLGRWYKFHAEYDAGMFDCTITDLSTGTVFGTLSISTGSGGVAYLSFNNDNWHTAGSSLFSDVIVEYYYDSSDMNPAHIIRECLTDLDWGMGYQDADIDDAAFTAAADALFDEQMGMSLLWDRQIPIEDFIKEVLKHIDATLYVDRTTGKFALKLVRADYDPESLLVLDPSNVDHVDAFKAPALGELVNSVTVKYWDTTTGEDASLSVQDIALVQVQGTTIAATSEYPGFTNGALAARVAARDLRALSTPLVSCTLYATRVASALNVGDVFRLDWPDYGVANLIMRVTQIALGDGRNNQVRITCVQDVFGLPLAIHAPPVASEWSAPDLTPTPSPHHLAIEAPYYELVQRMGADTVDTNLAARPDLGYVLVAGDRAGASLNARIMVDAGAGYLDSGAMDFAPYAELAADVGHTDETWSIANGVDLDQIETGTHAQVDDELVKVVSATSTSLSVRRGVLDTVPALHASGAMILFWDSSAATDEIEYVSGETVDAKILPVSGAGILDIGDAVADSVTFTQRAWRPYPPGRFKIGGAYWPETIGGSDELAITWAHRDRSQQTDGTLTDYSAASIGPETGTAYTIRVYGEAGDLVHTETALSGTAWTYTAAQEKSDAVLPTEGAVNLTALLLNFVGADESTSFVDDMDHSVTAGGNAKISTDNTDYAGSTGYLDGSGDYLSVAYGADLDPGTAAFTVEVDSYLLTIGERSFASTIDNDADTNKGFELGLNASGNLVALIYAAGGGLVGTLTGTTTVSANERHHAALEREGTTYRLLLDGAVEATNSALGSIDHSNSGMTIGAARPGARYTHGDIGAVRYVIGKALYGGAYTPPTLPLGKVYSDDTEFRLNGQLRVELESVRPIGGITSWQHHDHTVYRTGYGFNYGMFYGGV